jgi:coenzyme Q-binding protein COQ10
MPYTPDQMFDLVADVKAYQEFLPWVIAMRVRKDGAEETVADMIVGFKGLRETFTSRIEKQRPNRIYVDYVDGPMKYLYNEWRFRPDGNGCLVDFSVDFQFKNRMFEVLAGQVFGIALRKMIGAFEDRARTLYGLDASAGSGGISKSSAHNAA